ncbi:DUF58 domain-containing protein [Paenibacillus glycanilyticus]|uniref:DUF58 domain-containing protein n=1 Tax=Paenibacillus glycanilyticus TaxID=126569 RepID=A0ABQ6G7B5_9BACL|nr:DUF58 domain-containing protein [Paenibacillus glycanilyticus]GLX66844.1 hypothetical protein MU1_11880 [Paenibacillus glycanilyticus]
MSAVKGMKTRKRWRLIAFIYGAALLYLLFQGGKTALMLFVILNVLLLYLVLGRWSGISKVSGIRSYRLSGAAALSDQSLTAGSTLDVQLTVKVPGVYPIPYVLLRDKLLRHNGQQLKFEASFVPNFKRAGEVLYQTPPLERGEYRFDSTECISHDIFGLFEHSGSFGSEAVFSVLPQIIPLRQWHSIQSGFRGPYSHAVAPRAAKETTQINGVREYLYGDRLSRIHWNATAKTGDWKSKAFERESLPRTLIILDRYSADYPAPAMDKFELAVSAAASLIDSGLKGDTAIGLMSSGKKLTMLPPKSGVDQRNVLLRHLTFVDADAEQGLYKSVMAADSRLEPGSYAIIISGTSGKEAILSMEWLSRKGLTPCLMHIGGVKRLEEQSRLMIRSKGWSLFELKQLQELPAVLEGGRA